MTNKPFPAPAVLTLLASLTMLLAACANNPAAGQEPNSTGTAGRATTARPHPTPSTAAPTSAPQACPYDGTPIAIRPGDQHAPVCLHPGDTLTLTAPPSPIQSWQPPTSSDAAILRCEAHTSADGALTATCHALAIGTVTVSTTTAPFAGDPHGPAQYLWTITLHVAPTT